MTKINNLVGLSIYPVSWLVSIVINLINGQPNAFDFPGSIPFWLIFAFFNFFGFGFLAGLILLILTWINFIIFTRISSFSFKNDKFRLFILLVVYLILVFINAYNDPNIEM